MQPEVMPPWQWCQRWNAGTHTWRHVHDGGFDQRRYEVAALGEAEAKAYVVHHHYSHSYPAARLRYGLYERGRLSGVVVLGIPMHDLVLTNAFPRLQPYTESLELSRMVLADRVPANGESWFLARVFADAARQGVRGVLAFADPVARRVHGRLVFPGHIGISYQAANALYLGRSSPRTLLVLPDGTTFSERAKQKILSQHRGRAYAEAALVRRGARPRLPSEDPRRWLVEALASVGATRIRHRGCHRYAFRLGPPLARRRVVVGAEPQSFPKPTP